MIGHERDRDTRVARIGHGEAVQQAEPVRLASGDPPEFDDQG